MRFPLQIKSIFLNGERVNAEKENGVEIAIKYLVTESIALWNLSSFSQKNFRKESILKNIFQSRKLKINLKVQ